MREKSAIVQLLVDVGCGCEDENGEGLDECTGKCTAARAQAEYERLLDEPAKLSKQLSASRRQAQACIHVIVKLDVDHAALDVCGCEQCNEVRRGLVEAGYLERREADG